MRFIEIIIYLLFAVAHPMSEIRDRTSLRKFLNKTYYKTNRDDFPVNRFFGIAGSLLVLVVLVIPFAIPLWGRDAPAAPWWCLALGLVLADVIQHAIHSLREPQEPAPRIHLITIIGVLFLLLLIFFQDFTVETIRVNYRWLLAGALLIFLNWSINSFNSWRVKRRLRASNVPPASPSAVR